MPALKPLPDCEGPKLEPCPFDVVGPDCQWLAVIEDGHHSAVVKAAIKGKLYAIKIFFPESLKIVLGTEEIDHFKPLVGEKAMILHLAPFNAECRAFGRLKEMDCEHAAVRVYGYVNIDMTEAVEQKIRGAMPGRFDDPRSMYAIEGVDLVLCRVGNTGPPIMAIVKDWIEAAPDFRTDMIAQGRSFRRILKNLHKLHRCGIVVRDISDAQFVNGVLVDLSHARTTPHVFGPDSGIRPAWEWASMAAYDLYSLQEMIDWWNETEWSWIPGDAPAPKKCTLRAYGDPEGVVLDRLRPRARLECQRPYLRMIDLHDYEYLQMTHPPRYDPAAFDWRKAVERKKKRGAQAKPSPSSTGRVQSRVRLGRKRGHASTGRTRKAAAVKQENGVRVEEE